MRTGARQARLHGALAYPQHGTHGRDVETDEVVEDDDLALPTRQRSHRVFEVDAILRSDRRGIAPGNDEAPPALGPRGPDVGSIAGLR